MRVGILSLPSFLLVRRPLASSHLQSATAGVRMMMSTTAFSDYMTIESLLVSHISAAEGGNPSFDPSSVQRRVQEFYLPVYRHFSDVVVQSSSSGGSKRRRPIFIGISAPQGCGKTTLTDYMRLLFANEGKSCVVMSLDDFYLTGAEQDDLSRRTSNPLLALRGNAGSHDVPLMMQTLQALAACEEVDVPRYDKALRGGRGDRSPSSSWQKVPDGGADVVLFEGWMLGFAPLDGKDATALAPSLQQINELLRSYEQLHKLFDAWLVLALADLSAVYEWRAQAERAAVARGRAGLSEEQIRDFVSRFMPAYEAYLPRLYQVGPYARAVTVPVLKITVDSDRSVTGRVLM